MAAAAVRSAEACSERGIEVLQATGAGLQVFAGDLLGGVLVQVPFDLGGLSRKLAETAESRKWLRHFAGFAAAFAFRRGSAGRHAPCAMPLSTSHAVVSTAS